MARWKDATGWRHDAAVRLDRYANRILNNLEDRMAIDARQLPLYTSIVGLPMAVMISAWYFVFMRPVGAIYRLTHKKQLKADAVVGSMFESSDDYDARSPKGSKP